MLKVTSLKNPTESRQEALKETAPACGCAGEIDVSLLEESLRLTPWERMLANDDALNFGESLRSAMERYRAESSPMLPDTPSKWTFRLGSAGYWTLTH
jgi:hypothetical protein